ncbi:tRNA (adenosine(37)-N6)-threonylcarbamoyltransferase complex dimerization subunit type 1 TsaB [Paenibacillus sp. IHBB 10380]|uniref:tRNA (adenosine(37)-N6)-threonylcarbamoyltransferase complex dimerization subunit type 1 TsaB n=1 Tax=Paenibacillus sp. IHBB 10380 TaxID=1566358 RepID=UPI0005CFA2FF|nr:tRNA (adenosine(37)-N6)-threonylcarbamoyltransferase complex dimerization subunit type 1 TsaB [Paenibacillus sp. IHBB 10380]AJS60019.1 peptidase M22 [Paenibacillus sp. IHBB 10380]
MSIQQESESQARFLALDTSTTSLAVSVIENDKVLHEINAYGVRNHSVRILSIIEEALKVSNTTNIQVEGIAVGIGPGSYTGTRIAVTAAKTLAWAWEVPVVGISSLHALAYGGYTLGVNKLAENTEQDHKERTSWIIPLLDARRGQVFTALFSMDHEAHIPNRLEQDGIRLMETWVEQLISLIETLEVEDRPDSVWVVGDVSLHAEAATKLSSLLGEHLHIVPYDLEGRFVGILGADRLLKGDMDDMHALVPNYTQLAEAEANLLRALKEGR